MGVKVGVAQFRVRGKRRWRGEWERQVLERVQGPEVVLTGYSLSYLLSEA